MKTYKNWPRERESHDNMYKKTLHIWIMKMNMINFPEWLKFAGLLKRRLLFVCLKVKLIRLIETQIRFSI